MSEQFDLINEELIVSIGDFYERIFRRSSGFHLNLYETFHEANRVEKYVLPPLDFQTDEEEARTRKKWNYWSSPISRKIQLYEGFSKPPTIAIELPPNADLEIQ